VGKGKRDGNDAASNIKAMARFTKPKYCHYCTEKGIEVRSKSE